MAAASVLRIPFRLAPVTAAATVPLRHAVLRPMQAEADCIYDQDATAGAYHAGAFVEDRLIGVASVFPESEDGRLHAGDWRIRGMAVAERFRGHRIGAALLHAVVAHCALQQDGGLLWCNARVPAESFYRRFGFVRGGDPFDQPPLGPCVRMHRPLGPGDRVYRM